MIKKTITRIIRKSKEFHNCLYLIRSQRSNQVQFYNMWVDFERSNAYWERYLKFNGLLDAGKSIAVFSCIGPRYLIDLVHTDVKVFYTGENLKRTMLNEYADYTLRNPSVDFAMGFEVFEDTRYVRFPLWMEYMFAPEFTEDDICVKCEQLRFPNTPTPDARKFCCMVASNAADGLRNEMFDALSKIAHVDSAGELLHNDDSLKDKFGDVKIEYMKQYAFNICPENSSAYGYTTEKLFESIAAGCIPVYWGAELADKAVINEDAVIFWDRKNKGKEAIKRIAELYANPKLLEEFLKQPRLKSTAEEYVLDTFATVESKLRAIINSKSD